MKSAIFFITFISLVASCGKKTNQPEKVINKSIELFFENLFENSDEVKGLVYDSSKINLDLLIKKEREEGLEFTGFVYVVNSECSVCMEDFLNFAEHLKRIGGEASLIALVADESKAVLEYYLEMAELSDMDITLVENRGRYIQGSLEDQNGNVFHFYEDALIDVFSYLSYKYQ